VSRCTTHQDINSYPSLTDDHPPTLLTSSGTMPLPKNSGVSSVRACSPFGNQMEREMCSCLKRQRDIEPGTLNESESMVWRDLKDSGPYLVHCTLLAPSSGPFAHPKQSTKNIQTAIPSFGPRAPPSSPLTMSATPEKSQRTAADSHPAPQEPLQLPAPPTPHPDILCLPV
jgi:hypothetical protein